MDCNFITPLLVYNDLYESTYKDLIKYGLTPDQASRKANIYCVKNTWRFFTSEDVEAKFYRTLLCAKINQWAKVGFLADAELDDLLRLKEANETVS